MKFYNKFLHKIIYHISGVSTSENKLLYPCAYVTHDLQSQRNVYEARLRMVGKQKYLLYTNSRSAKINIEIFQQSHFKSYFNKCSAMIQ